MNKKEVSMFLTGVIGRLLCADRLGFQRWVAKRLNRAIFIDEYNLQHATQTLSREIADTITDAEWREIADFFIEPESKVIDKEALQTLCMRYDRIYGPRRGSVYEGLDICNFYLEEICEDIIRSKTKWMKMAREKPLREEVNEKRKTSL